LAQSAFSADQNIVFCFKLRRESVDEQGEMAGGIYIDVLMTCNFMQ